MTTLYSRVAAIVLLLLLSSTSYSQVYWTSIDGDADSIATVSHVTTIVDRINTRFTVDSIVSPTTFDAIAGSMAMAENGHVFIGTANGVTRFESRIKSSTIVLSRRAVRLTVLGGNLFAATDSGLFVTSTDGDSWIKSAYFGNLRIRFVTNDGTFLYAATDSSLFRSTNVGQTWQQLSLPEVGMKITFLGGACGQILLQLDIRDSYRSVDGGASFNVLYLNGAAVTDLLCDDSLTYGLTSYEQVFILGTGPYPRIDTIFAVTLASFDAEHKSLVGIGDIYARISKNRAKSWTSTFANHDDPPYSVVSNKSGNSWVALEHSAITSTDGGITWQPVGPVLRIDSIAHYDTTWKYDTTYTTDTLRTHTLMSNRAVRGMVTVHGNELVCATDIGIVRSVDKGAHWSLSNSGMRDSNLVAITSNGVELYAATASTLYRSLDFGMRWDSTLKGWTTQAITSLAAAPNYLIVGTSSGIFRTVNDGASWTGLETAKLGQTNFRGVLLAPWGTLFSWIQAGVIRSTNAGSTFESTGIPDARDLRNVYANAGIVVNTHDFNTLSISENNGDSWTDVHLGDQLYRVGVSPTGSILAQGNTFIRLDSVNDRGHSYADPWRGYFTDYAFDSTGGQYASLDKNGVLYHHDEQALVTSNAHEVGRLSVYPNPGRNVIHLALIEAMNDISIELVNAVGQFAIKTTSSNSHDHSVLDLDVSQLPPGAYECIVRSSTGIQTAPVVLLP